MNEVQLTSCDQEPIHIPGKIQGHGFLLATDQLFNITHCSENVKDFLKLPASEILGKSINALTCFSDVGGQSTDLTSLIKLLVRQQKSQQISYIDQLVHGKSFSIAVQNHNAGYLLDFEPEISDLHSDIQGLIGRSLSEMLSDKDFTNLLTNAADQVAQVIGYDRVMIYKFHDDGHGEVMAESKGDHLESWMGLHYPASDIPQQARELYKLNPIRLIADVHTETSAILALPAHVNTPLDLTYDNLRAVSPVHIKYLINMGVASSFSISIMDQHKLWGLIACHNYTPRYINVSQRESAKLVGQVLSSAIGFREQDQEQKKTAQHRRTIEYITRHLLRNIPVREALAGQSENTLLDVLPCTGAALHFENELSLLGETPPIEFLSELIKWLDKQTYEDGYYLSNKLSADFPAAIPFKDSISGLLAYRLGKDLNEYMLWFRPEVISTVKWAGEPVKIQETDDNGILRISPRNSFREWTEEVKMTSLEWKKHELDAAMSLRDEVNYAINRKATELRITNEKLRLAYAELDTFSYTISHDLKNPLTTIKCYAELIDRDGISVEKVRTMAQKISKGAIKMQNMIDEVLQYSKIGQSRIQVKVINMQKLLDELRQDLLISSKNNALLIDLTETPEILGDELMVFQVFSNIVGNAVKYSSKTAIPVVTISGTSHQHEVIYTVSDNGIGIPETQHTSIFELFSRATTGNDFDGTGVGLAIVKRIMDKHNGRIWLESKPGEGSTFNMAFKHQETTEIR